MSTAWLIKRRMPMIETIQKEGEMYALIIRHTYQKEGITFVTPPVFSQQLAYMCHPTGKVIQPHKHNPIPRQVVYTQEVLVIRRGKLRVDLFDTAEQYFVSTILETGDVILLAQGGHGFEVLETVEMIEVKQGPYCGGADKTHFQPRSLENKEYV